MSRVGKNPIVLPAGVEITLGEQITVKGPLGTLQIAANDAVEVKKEGQEIVVSKVEGAVNASAMWGTMIVGAPARKLAAVEPAPP